MKGLLSHKQGNLEARLLAERIRHHAEAMNNHWCELAGAILDLNRLMPQLPAEIAFDASALRSDTSAFLKASVGSDQLSIRARQIHTALKQQNLAALKQQNLANKPETKGKQEAA